MPKLFSVKTNDAPDIVLTLLRSNSPINVAGATVDLFMNLNGTIANTGHTSCTLTTPLAGIVTYSPTSTDFAAAGTYNCEVRITYPDATTEILYQKFTISVRDNLE
jgi:hypothetical protein